MMQLDLLGGFHAHAASGERVHLPTRKSEALLAYLALYPDRAHARESLMNLLWGDRSTTQARNSLRQALSSLHSDRASVRLDPDAAVVDALELERLASAGSGPRLDAATALYRGEFLAGMVIRDAAAEEWLESERRRFHRAAVTVFTQLLAEQVGGRELAAAIPTGERLVELDPLNEAAWRSLIGVYAESGRRNDALEAYRRCQRKTTTELGVDPEPETRELEAAVRDRVFAGKGTPCGRAEARRPVLPRFAPTDRPTLLVLPFAARGLDAAHEFLADGVTEDLTIGLSRYRELYVMAPATAFLYATRSAGLDPATYGRELRATYLVTGSVRPAGVEFRLSVQLLEVATSRCVWAEQFPFAIEDWLWVESEIAGRVAASLVEGIEASVRSDRSEPSPWGCPPTSAWRGREDYSGTTTKPTIGPRSGCSEKRSSSTAGMPPPTRIWRSSWSRNGRRDGAARATHPWARRGSRRSARSRWMRWMR